MLGFTAANRLLCRVVVFRNDMLMYCLVDQIVMVCCKLKSPSIELEVFYYSLGIVIFNACDKSMVTRPCVVCIAWDEGYVVCANVPFVEVVFGLIGILAYDDKMLALCYFFGYVAETLDGLVVYRSPVCFSVWPCHLYEFLFVPLRWQVDAHVVCLL